MEIDPSVTTTQFDVYLYDTHTHTHTGQKQPKRKKGNGNEVELVHDRKGSVKDPTRSPSSDHKRLLQRLTSVGWTSALSNILRATESGNGVHGLRLAFWEYSSTESPE